MTVSSNVSKSVYYGSGSVGPFTFGFKFFANGDIAAYKVTSGGSIVSLSEGGDYSLTGAGSENGGVLTLTSALLNGETMTIKRVMDITQETSFENQGAFYPGLHEKAFDRTTMMVQQIDEKVDDFDSSRTEEYADLSAKIAALSAGLPTGALSDFSADLKVRNVIVLGTSVDARAFGALGGVIADRVALQQAADSIANTGGVLWVPAGVYNLTLGNHPDDASWKVGFCLPGNVTLRGAGKGATVLKLAANQVQGRMVMNRHINAYSDNNIGVFDLTFDGNAANQNIGVALAHVGFGPIRARNVLVSQAQAKNVFGTAGTGDGEGFHFEVGLCTDVLFSGCDVLSDDGGSTSSGFSADVSANILYENCIARGMAIANGFTHNNCAGVFHSNCRSYLNTSIMFNSEVSTDVHYSNCGAGGVSASVITPGMTANQSLGGGLYGFVFNGTNDGSITGGYARKIGGPGVYIAGDYINASDADLRDNTIAVAFDSVAHTLTGKLSNLQTGGNSIAELSLQGAGGVGYTPYNSDYLVTPAVPATTAALVNPFPFDVSILVKGVDTLTDISVKGRSVIDALPGAGITKYRRVSLKAGWPIALTYTGATPTWDWTAL